MKFLKFFAVFLVVFSLFVPKITKAESYIPKDIKLFSAVETVDAGSVIDFAILSGNKTVKPNTVFEYGIAKEITEGFITSFNIITTETVAAGEQVKLSTKVPNMSVSSSTYVVYLKSYVKNDPDSENFFVTQSFNIVPNNDPFVHVKIINLLHSNGLRFELNSGPSIYKLEDISTSTQATTTELEITFESNTDTVLKPQIEFRKLRSEVGVPEFIPSDINIKKGTNYIRIPLPTFSYEPGVYIGKLKFRNPLLQNEIDFQYIVSGESVTIGQVNYSPQGEFMFEVFGVPVDVFSFVPNFSDNDSSSSQQHSVKSEFKHNGKVVYSTTTVVDFASTSFSIYLPDSIKVADSVELEVLSSKTGKIIYKGTKDLDFKREFSNSNPFILGMYLFFVCLLIWFAFKRQKIKFLITLIVFILSIVSHKTFAETWNPGLYPEYLINYRDLTYTTEGYGNPIRVVYNEDLTTRNFACGEKLSFMFKVQYTHCSNSVVTMQVGFSTSSSADADTKQVDVSTNNDGKPLESQVHTKTYGEHYFYENTSVFKRYNGAALKPTDTFLYVSSNTYGIADELATAGYKRYKIPINVGACTACTNAPSTSNVPNFKLHNRSYYYSSSDSKLYFKEGDISSNAPASSCGIDMCSDTSEIEESFPGGLSWRPMPGTYSTSTNRYACLPINITCDCNASRDRVCANSNTGTTSTEFGHPSCVLQAYCSVSYPNRGVGTVTFDAYNKKGTLSFEPSGNPVADIEIPSDETSGITITRKVIDNFDGRYSTVSCVLKYDDSVVTNEGDASIISFYANPKIVSEGSKCKFGWVTNNMTSCAINGVIVPVNAFAGDLYSFEQSTSINDSNLKKTLICSGRSTSTAPIITVSTTTTCFVNPRVREN